MASDHDELNDDLLSKENILLRFPQNGHTKHLLGQTLWKLILLNHLIIDKEKSYPRVQAMMGAGGLEGADKGGLSDLESGKWPTTQSPKSDDSDDIGQAQPPDLVQPDLCT